MKKDVLLELKKLSKHFTVGGEALKAVDEIDLQLYCGEVLGLVGESGSGKSTLAKTLLGLHDKTSGHVYLEGVRLAQRYKRKDFQNQAEQVQMIFQDPSACLNPRMTVAEIIAEPLNLLNKKVDTQAVVRASLQRVNLPASALSRYPHEFSGGQRQRIGIARALVAEPKLLICDEPISALDVSVQAQVVNLLIELRRDMNLSLLFVAHDLSMVRYISDRIAVMYLGQLMEVAESEALFKQPLHPYTQLLLASNPVADPAVVPRLSVVTNEATGELSQGCCFAPRCEQAKEICWKQKPSLKAHETQRLIACHLFGGDS